MHWDIFFTTVGAVIAIIVAIYTILRNFKEDMNKALKDFNEKFEKHERRFERIDQRLFLLCMGKSLPDILKSEREEDMK